MEFVIKELSEDESIIEGHYKIHEDTCMMFYPRHGAFDLLLGESYYVGIETDMEDGKCYSLYSILSAVIDGINYTPLTVPESRKANLFFVYDHLEDGGCYYEPFTCNVYWDKEQKIMCIGNKYSEGETIEFATGTYAKIKDKRLLAVYVKFDFDCVEEAEKKEKLFLRMRRRRRRYWWKK